MRTTIDLDDELLQRLRDDAHREGVPFRAVLHRTLLRGLESEPQLTEVRYSAPSVSLGQVREGIDLVKARLLSDDLEDEEIMRKWADGR